MKRFPITPISLIHWYNLVKYQSYFFLKKVFIQKYSLHNPTFSKKRQLTAFLQLTVCQ